MSCHCAFTFQHTLRLPDVRVSHEMSVFAVMPHSLLHVPFGPQTGGSPVGHGSVLTSEYMSVALRAIRLRVVAEHSIHFTQPVGPELRPTARHTTTSARCPHSARPAAAACHQRSRASTARRGMDHSACVLSAQIVRQHSIHSTQLLTAVLYHEHHVGWSRRKGGGCAGWRH